MIYDINFINDMALPHTWHAVFARTEKNFEINLGLALGAINRFVVSRLFTASDVV